MLTKSEKAKIVKKFGTNNKDTGSYEVQVAILTADIEKLKDHFKDNPKDIFSHRGFMAKINDRKTLLKKLKSEDFNRYQKLIKELKLRK